MSDLSYEHQFSIRSTGEVKLALDQVVARLRSTGRVRFKGRKITQEAVVNATFLMLNDMDGEDLERWLNDYVPRLEQIVGYEPEADPAAESANRDRTTEHIRRGRQATQAQKPASGISGFTSNDPETGRPPQRRKRSG